MKRIKHLRSALMAAVLLPCLTVTSVTAAPSDGGGLEQQKEAAENEAQDLQAQLAELLNKVGEMEEKLIATGEKISQAEADLEEAEAEAQQQYETMKIRIKYMYEKGNSDIWATFLTAENFTDFLNKAEYASNLQSYDRKQLEKLVETWQQIEDLKETLETEQASLEEQQAAYIEEQERVNAELEEKRAEIADFDEQLQAAAEAAAREAQERDAENEDTGGASQTAASAGNSQSSSGTESGEGTSGGGTSGGGTSGGSTSSGGTSGGGTSGSGTSGSSSGTSAGNTAAAQAIVNAAYSQLGVPYKYGGTTPGVALDCSGLVQYCHSVAGISLPRTSQAQGGCGVAVTNPQPGDIVCYSGHVGIYIGNGQMIHAPKPGDVVKIADVYGSPWYRRCW